MPELNYRNKEDGASEERTRRRMKLFGLNRADVWQALAHEIGGQFTPGRWFNGKDVVRVSVGPWEVTLDNYVVSSGEFSVTYTRFRAPYVNADGFRFDVYRKSVFTGIGKWLGMQDVEVGNPEFDQAFVIKGTSETQLRRLFASERLRQLLMEQTSVKFEVCDDEGWFGVKFPEGVDELRFMAVGTIKDIEKLKDLYELFAETLHTLCHIGSAYEDDPGIRL